MAFYAHFSQSIFLHTITPFWLAVGATDICCTKVCLIYVCKSAEMWQKTDNYISFSREKNPTTSCLGSNINNIELDFLC